MKTIEQGWVTCPWCHGDRIDPDSLNLPANMFVSSKCWYCNGEGVVNLNNEEHYHNDREDS